MKIVVEDALNIAQSISPPQEQLYLDFPQINSERLTARVIHWQPIESNDSGDIAVLELDSPLPTKAKPVHFVYRDNLWDYKFRAFGFLNDYDEGVWIDGSIREKGVGGWLQVESGTGFSLGEGCSGTAIWNEELQGVVGMAVVAETSPNIKVGFCIPSPLLHQAIPAILEEHYLNEFCANLERKKSLRAFVELSAQADINTQSKKMNSSKRHLSEEWGLGSEFSILEQSDNAGSETADNQIQKKTLNNISEATQEYESFVLLGEPGMGKTTTLYRIAYNAACKRLGDASHPLPLLLKLPSWTDQRTINEFIRANWPFADDPIHRLINGDILLCLDGLNEINQESQENKQKVESLSEWLRSDKSPKHIVITCRVRDYSKELKLDLPVVLMEKMNESHIRAFVTSYLGSDTEQFLDKILPSVNSNKKDNNRHLFQLAQNPYFLTAFIVFYTTERERDLPSTQGQLFEVLVRQLWKREKDLRNAEELPDIQVAKRILGNLAFNMIDKNHSTQAPFVEAMKQSSENCLQSETVWELSQDAGLVEVENGNIHFSHQLLRDYFAALKLAELESVSKISKPSLSQNIFGWRTEGEWDQAIKILCELYSEKAEHYINHILNNKNSYLAAECLTGGVIASDEIVAKVIIDLLKDISLISPAEVARSFSIGVIVGLPLSGVSLLVPSWLSKPVTKHITSPIFSKIWKSIDGYRNEIKCAYISDLLEQIGKPTLPALKQCIDSKNESIRIFAVNNIRKIGDDVTAIQYLSEVFPLSEKANVRLFIINELKKFKELEKFGDSSKIMNVFCDALLDSSSSVRLAAFKAFCRVGRKTAALPHLVSALQHHEPNVRQFAAEKLGSFSKSNLKDKACVSGLIEALADSQVEVRRTAIKSLKKFGSSEISPILSKVLQDSDKDVRLTACEAVIEAQDYHSVFQALFESLNNDNEEIRLFSVSILEDIASNPDISDLVKTLAISGLTDCLGNAQAKIRATSAEALGKNQCTTVVTSLINLLNDTERPGGLWLLKRVCDVAAKSLKEIDTPEAKQAFEKWHQNKRKPFDNNFVLRGLLDSEIRVQKEQLRELKCQFEQETKRKQREETERKQREKTERKEKEEAEAQRKQQEAEEQERRERQKAEALYKEQCRQQDELNSSISSQVLSENFNFETVIVNLTDKVIGKTRIVVEGNVLGMGLEKKNLYAIQRKAKAMRNSCFKENLSEGVILTMVKIPSGSFMMGCPDTECHPNENDGAFGYNPNTDSEKPQHLVKIPEFWMGQYPVTQAQWRKVAAMPKVFKDLEANPSKFKGDQRPVERVSEVDAEEFCLRLSQATGKSYRLPTEAEWEYACRAGTTTPFYFGETITSDLVNYKGGSYNYGPKGKNRKETTPVGTFYPNTWGLYDMHGNVWERCLDIWHKGYDNAPTDGSARLYGEKEKSQVMRGGSWRSIPWLCRSSYRDEDLGKSETCGFRVVCRGMRTS